MRPDFQCAYFTLRRARPSSRFGFGKGKRMSSGDMKIQGADPIDGGMHMVANPQLADTRRRAGENQIPRGQTIHTRQGRDELGDLQGHLRETAVLALLSVNAQFERTAESI